MVATKLQHPGIFLGGLSENGDVVKVFAEDRVVAFLSLKELVAFHDLLNLLKTPLAERGRNQSQERTKLAGWTSWLVASRHQMRTARFAAASHRGSKGKYLRRSRFVRLLSAP